MIKTTIALTCYQTWLKSRVSRPMISVSGGTSLFVRAQKSKMINTGSIQCQLVVLVTECAGWCQTLPDCVSFTHNQNEKEINCCLYDVYPDGYNTVESIGWEIYIHWKYVLGTPYFKENSKTAACCAIKCIILLHLSFDFHHWTFNKSTLCWNIDVFGIIKQ